MKHVFVSTVLSAVVIIGLASHQVYNAFADHQEITLSSPSVSLETGVVADDPVLGEIIRVLDAKLKKNEKRLYELYPELWDTQAVLHKCESDLATHHDQNQKGMQERRYAWKEQIDMIINEIGNLNRSSDNTTDLKFEIIRKFAAGGEKTLVRTRRDSS